MSRAGWWIFSMAMLAIFLYSFTLIPPIRWRPRFPRWHRGHLYQEDPNDPR